MNFEIAYQTLGIHRLPFGVFICAALKRLINVFVQFQPVNYCVEIAVTHKAMLWVNYNCIFNLISNIWRCNIVIMCVIRYTRAFCQDGILFLFLFNI